MQFAGDFETHVTVRADDSAGADAVRAWAEVRGAKFHHIVLARGRTPSQPMVTRPGRGVLADQLAAADALQRDLAAAGFAVTRVKVEAAPWNADVPDADAVAVARHTGRHFEHHVKLVLDPAADLAALAELAGRHAAHLSRNARRVRPDGLHERFVTQRVYAAGRPTARGRLDALLAALAAAGYAVEKVEEEFVVFDSNPGVDAGWLDPGGVP